MAAEYGININVRTKDEKLKGILTHLSNRGKEKDVRILNSGCVKISFPQFYEIFEKYGRNS